MLCVPWGQCNALFSLFNRRADVGRAPRGDWFGRICLSFHALGGYRGALDTRHALPGPGRAVCRTGTDRAWWLGFFVFGWAYVGLTSHYVWFDNPILPTDALVKLFADMIGIPPWENQLPISENALRFMFLNIGASVWILLSGLIGGFLARRLFGKPAASTAASGDGTEPTNRVEGRKWAIPATIVVFILTLITAIALTGTRLNPGIWAGSTYLLTWWLLGLMALAALYSRGRSREIWLGATFLGIGFLFLVFSRSPFESDVPDLYIPTVEFLEAVRPPFEALAAGLAGSPNSVATTNARIRRVLRQRVPMRFPDETTLQDVIQSIQQATRGPDGKVIPIYVDPIGLAEAEKSLTSTVYGMNLEGVTLQTSLRYCLKQLDLDYVVKGELLLITSLENESNGSTWPNEDPFLVVGHCLLALIAAGLGGLVAPRVCDLARETRA